MQQDNFIGIGRNPDGPDLPLGLGMRLAQEPKAMAAFGKLSEQKKSDLINQIQAATTGKDAKNRIEEAVNMLNGGQAR